MAINEQFSRAPGRHRSLGCQSASCNDACNLTLQSHRVHNLHLASRKICSGAKVFHCAVLPLECDHRNCHSTIHGVLGNFSVEGYNGNTSPVHRANTLVRKAICAHDDPATQATVSAWGSGELLIDGH